jgi:hypothetical protein
MDGDKSVKGTRKGRKGVKDEDTKISNTKILCASPARVDTTCCISDHCTRFSNGMRSGGERGVIRLTK